MFQTIRQVKAILQTFAVSPSQNQANTGFTSLLSSLSPSDLSIEEVSLYDKDSRLWKDYQAVGFDGSGSLRCSAKNACYD